MGGWVEGSREGREGRISSHFGAHFTANSIPAVTPLRMRRTGRSHITVVVLALILSAAWGIPYNFCVLLRLALGVAEKSIP